MPFTNGFADSFELSDHFLKHGTDFSAINESDYEIMADKFLGGKMDRDTVECLRRNGDRIRFNKKMREFGVLRNDGIIKTYYKPDPKRFPNALAYFQSECKK